MNVVLIVLHIVACLILVLVVLLQQGKGADMGAVFGGSSSTIFGSSGAGNFLTRLTTGAAAVFMLTSLSLTYLSSHRFSTSVFDAPLPEPPPIQAPAGAENPAPGGAPIAAGGAGGVSVEIPAAEIPAAPAPVAAVAEPAAQAAPEQAAAPAPAGSGPAAAPEAAAPPPAASEPNAPPAAQ